MGAPLGLAGLRHFLGFSTCEDLEQHGNGTSHFFAKCKEMEVVVLPYLNAEISIQKCLGRSVQEISRN